MRIPRHRIQRTMAQQVKRVLVVLVLVLIVYIVGSLLLLNRERALAIQELNQMSELYTSELDNRFQRVSRRLFSLMMEKNQPTSVFWNYVNMMDEEYDLDYPLVKLRENFLSSAWEYGQEYCFFLYLEDKERYFRLSIDSEGSYIGQEDVEQAVLWQIEHLKDAGMSYSVKKKWNIIASGGENYMCKIAQNQGVYLGCYVNVKSILEPFSSITMGKNGYVCLVNEQGESVGMLTSEGILDKESGGSGPVLNREAVGAGAFFHSDEDLRGADLGGDDGQCGGADHAGGDADRFRCCDPHLSEKKYSAAGAAVYQEAGAV